ncbi:YdcF family protein [Gallaecimonas sp. GXIMD1310]|uniref:YdcF family protein n=1 Tax=Gallaecimonas sp. GXIMD1310 TaxID=3131926 RepID=UPI0032498487
MTLLVLLALLLLAAIAARRRWPKTAWSAALSGLLLLLLAGTGWLPGQLLAALQSAPGTAVKHWGQRNVIILLGAGTVKRPDGQVSPGVFADARLLKAATLYRQCQSAGGRCWLLVSGGDAAGTGRSEAAVYGKALQSLGVPKEALRLEKRSLNTWQNAQFSAPILASLAADNQLLVSSAFHLHRAALYFRHFGVDATPVGAGYLMPYRSALPLAYNLTLTDIALHEYLGMTRYYLYQWLGWNVQAQRPGDL